MISFLKMGVLSLALAHHPNWFHLLPFPKNIPLRQNWLTFYTTTYGRQQLHIHICHVVLSPQQFSIHAWQQKTPIGFSGSTSWISRIDLLPYGPYEARSIAQQFLGVWYKASILSSNPQILYDCSIPTPNHSSSSPGLFQSISSCCTHVKEREYQAPWRSNSIEVHVQLGKAYIV